VDESALVGPGGGRIEFEDKERMGDERGRDELLALGGDAIVVEGGEEIGEGLALDSEMNLAWRFGG
jgi:hypothetical protein